MKVTILTARRITKAIDKLLGELVPLKQDRYGLRERSSNEHYIYPNSDDATLVGDLKIKETLNDFTILSNIKFALRLDIGKANEASDINNLQNKSKSIEALNNGLNSSPDEFMATKKINDLTNLPKSPVSLHLALYTTPYAPSPTIPIISYLFIFNYNF